MLMVSQNLVLQLLNANQTLKHAEFTVSLELLFRFVLYRQPFSQFVIMCESAPYIFAEEQMSKSEQDTCILNPIAASEGNSRSSKLIRSAQVYLSKLAENLLKFIELYQKQLQTEDAQNILEELFPTMSGEDFEKYSAVLNTPIVRQMIVKVTREDALFIAVSKDFKSCRHFLVNNLIDKFCRHDVRSIQTDEAREHILRILHNSGRYKIDADKSMSRKIDKVLEILEQYVDAENPFQFRPDCDLPNVPALRETTALSKIDYSNKEGKTTATKRVTSGTSSSSCEVGPKQQQYQVLPSQDLRLGQKHRHANTMTIAANIMQANLMRKGMDFMAASVAIQSTSSKASLTSGLVSQYRSFW